MTKAEMTLFNDIFELFSPAWPESEIEKAYGDMKFAEAVKARLKEQMQIFAAVLRLDEQPIFNPQVSLKNCPPMNEEEIRQFIEKRQKKGDHWTPEEVRSTYGFYSLDEALRARKRELNPDPLARLMEQLIDPD